MKMQPSRATADRFTARLYRSERFPDPGFVKMLFSSPKMAPIYLAIRVYLGWQWLHNGMFKVIDPAWTQTGIKLQTTWATDTALRAGQKGALIHYGWYHAFLTYMLPESLVRLVRQSASQEARETIEDDRDGDPS